MKTITQTQIAAFEKCRRFYYLKYVEKIAWPVEEKVSEEIQRGADFHLLARQLIMGLKPADLLYPSDDEKIRVWVDNFRRMFSPDRYDQVFAEKEASAIHSDVLWLGMFDALAIKEDRITIFDWKTTGHPAAAEDYLRSPQTKLYRFLAKMCAPRLLGSGLHGLPAENIEMIYRFPDHPEAEIRLPYSESAFQEDLTWLQYKAAEMSFADREDYPRTEKQKVCRYCRYETYCFPREELFPEELQVPEPAETDDVFQPALYFEDLPEEEPEAASF